MKERFPHTLLGDTRRVSRIRDKQSSVSGREPRPARERRAAHSCKERRQYEKQASQSRMVFVLMGIVRLYNRDKRPVVGWPTQRSTKSNTVAGYLHEMEKTGLSIPRFGEKSLVISGGSSIL